MATPQFRCLSPVEHDAFQRVLDYAFSAEDGPQQYGDSAGTNDESANESDGLGRRFGVVADGTVRSVCKHYEFTVSLRDEWVPLAGLAALATLPEYRRQGDGRRLVSYYSGFTDFDTYRGLLGHLSNHDSQVDEVRLYRNAGSSLLDAVTDPGAVDCEIHSGAMVRVVDVVDTLETVPYPDGCSETVTLGVSDDTAEWNDGQFELSVSDGRGTCRRISESDPDAVLDVGTLTQLLVGFHSVDEARTFGDLRVSNEDIAPRLSALFPPRTVCPLDNF